LSDAGNDNLILFETGRPLTEEFRYALVVFSLVPFLGILFSMPAILICGISSFTKQAALDKKLTLVSLIVFAMQIGLWSLLYLAPKLAI